MHRRAGEGTVLARAVLAPRATGCLVELLSFWRGGVRKACSSSNFCGGRCPGADRRGARGDSRALAVLSGEPSAMPQDVAFGWFVGEAVLGSLAMEWDADGEVLEVDGHWGPRKGWARRFSTAAGSPS